MKSCNQIHNGTTVVNLLFISEFVIQGPTAPSVPTAAGEAGNATQAVDNPASAVDQADPVAEHAASVVLGPPPATVDFVSQVWNSFDATVLPLCGGVAQEAVRTNRDPLEIGDYAAVKIQTEILENTYSKYRYTLGDQKLQSNQKKSFRKQKAANFFSIRHSEHFNVFE
jgi:hypothetical protein